MTSLAPPPVSLVGVRAASRAPRTVRVSAGRQRHRPHQRLLLGAVLACAMAGALLGTAAGLVLLDQRAPLELLRSYGLGAAAGAVVGLLLGWLAARGADRLSRRHPARRAWVRYRRAG